MGWGKDVGVALAGLLLGFGSYWSWSADRIGQPFPFNHAKHRGMTCAACHLGAEARAAAGILRGEMCAQCHATPPLPGSQLERAWELTVRGEIPWGRLYRVPTHVYFSHRRHVALARLDCADCHGDMGSRVRPPAQRPTEVSMEQCIACHRRERASDDCASCHR